MRHGNAFVLVLALIGGAQAQTETAKAGPWFGVSLPLRVGAEPAIMLGDREPHPFVLAKDEPLYSELAGATLAKDVATIVGFSKASRDEKEVGSGQLWGRISGFASGERTIDWALTQFRKAGIADVRAQPIEQEGRASLWLPLEWEVRLVADARFGAGTQDVVLDSAMPLPPSNIASAITAPLIYVGTASPAVLSHVNVTGKIAVQSIVPQGHMPFERSVTSERAQDLIKRGAVGVINLVRLPGNERARDFSNCGNPCFNLGGRDGWFLEEVLDRAATAGLNDAVRARVQLKTQQLTGLKSHNGVAVVPGKSDEVIVIDAHADAWFDGAGDNADGLAVMVALARHFAKPQNKPARTLAFIASAGHHTSGINGPRNFVRANPELASKAVLAINIEHVAQRNITLSRSVGGDGYRQFTADGGEAPISFGVSNASKYLNDLARQGVQRYGVNLVAQNSTMQSGETGGFADITGAKITVMQAPPLYHTTGETIEMISTPGLERMARFLRFYIEEAGKAPRERLNP